MATFTPLEATLDFPKAEEAVLAFWQEHDIFRRQAALHGAEACRAAGRPHQPFVFYEGPPTANGMPHPGHVLTRVIKDVFLRAKAMQGYDCLRKAGWDTHGLPVEIEVEKELGIEGKEAILDYGVEPFVRKCKDSVFRYSDAWRKLTERIGFWVDLDDPYVTYHPSYIESVWWILKQFWDAGLLYHGHKIVPYCPRCGTALSSHEVGLGYKEVADPSVFVAFRAKGEAGLSLVAWTTTPWTLLSNVALAVGPDYDYDWVRVGDETLVMASALRAACMGKIEHEVVKTAKGRELVGLEYEPLFPYATPDKPAYRVVAGDFVGLEAGSGIVHIAPAFGEDDYRVGRENDLPVVNLVEPDGAFSAAVEPWAGVFVKDADKGIIRALRDRQQVLKAEQYTHDYPFCWRCDSPLIYYARPTWYVRTTAIKDRMLANNATVDWRPDHIRDGRFGNFLETNVDWALSRERFWGTPLPIWRCEGCDYQTAVGSLAELRERADGDPGAVELHKPYVDEVLLNCPQCSSHLRRVSEVIDCWFDSGAMPLAQWGYPHADGSADRLGEAYPADFITEAIDQTRGWFYSLLAIGTLLGECARIQQEKGALDAALAPFLDAAYPLPYRKCLVLGHVCDEEGYKMSKSKGNYLDPWEIMHENGADAMRWYFYSNNQPWVSVRFFREAVRDAQKDYMVRLRNVWQFFTIYAEIDGFDPGRGLGETPAVGPAALAQAEGYVPLADRSLLDRWIRSKLASTRRTVTERLDALDVYGACRALHGFVDALSNWYVRRSRPRYWREARPEDTDKWAAWWTLYECLVGAALLNAPVLCFMAEEMYRRLVAGVIPGAPESVHLHPWPAADEAAIDEAVEAQMDRVREIASLGLSARASCKLKVRQPLGEAEVILADPADRAPVEALAEIIRDEVNVKALHFTQDAETYVSFEVRPNFKTLGPRLGKDVKQAAGALAKLDAAAVARAANAGEPVTVAYEGGSVDLGPEDLDIRLQAREGYVAAQGPHCVVVLNTEVTPELKREGLAREVVSRIQALRKELDLPFEARIAVGVEGDDAIAEAVAAHEEMIRRETLAAELAVGAVAGGETREVSVEKTPVVLSLRVV
ncbi:MAG: isoleucine--tRNA ligase [Planctomycetota bacterium]